MQRAEYQVPGVRSPNGHLGSIRIPDLAHQDYIGILAERGYQSVVKRGGIHADLPLIDQG